MSNSTLAPPVTAARSHTDRDWGLLFLRLALGLVFMVHGSQKMFGAFGGPGLAHMMGPQEAGGMGPVLGLLVSVGEFFGGLGLVVGFLTRFSASALIVIMLGAIFTVHAKNGFFMNWGGKQAGEGIEYHLLVIGMCLAILVAGPGRLVLGRLLPLPKQPETDQLVPILE